MLKPLTFFSKVKATPKVVQSTEVKHCIDRYVQEKLRTSLCRCEHVESNGTVTITAVSGVLKQEVHLMAQEIIEHIQRECGFSIKKLVVY